MPSGTLDVTSKDAGTFDYTISCTHDAQTLPAFSTSVTVFYGNVAGGALDWSLLLALTIALAIAFSARMRHDPAERSKQ